MKTILVICCLLTISCYNNPLSQNTPKHKPLYIKQYEERNKKEQLQTKKSFKKVEVIKPKERKIKYNFKSDIK